MELKRFEKRVWLASPTMHEEEQKFVQEAFDTNWITTLGANINELEKGICEYVGCKEAVALASGTSALHMAVRLAGVNPGDKIFCSDLTFSATVNPVIYEKCEPIFIDSERDTWNMDPNALEKGFELYPEVKAVIVVNLYGTPAKLDDIRAICQNHGAILIEDAAESLGAIYKGVQTGTFGTYNAISFNGNKIITTSGGGMLLTDDKGAAAKVRKWSTQARENAPWYQHEELGFNYRMSNIVAGIGRGQLLHLEEHVAAKKTIYERYKEGFKELPVKMNPFDKATMEPNYWLSCMLIEKEAMCKQMRSATKASYVTEPGKTCPTEILERLASYNVEGRPIWKPMHMQPIFKDFLLVTARGTCVNGQEVIEHKGLWDCPTVAVDLFERGLCLPSDIKMTAQEQEIVIEIVRSCFE